MRKGGEGKSASDLDRSMTEIGVPYGTLGYGSPEQAIGERVDGRTDFIFGRGVVIYEMVTGQQPFCRPEPDRDSACDDQRPAISDRRPWLSILRRSCRW
jgi:serine/threonine protein kinase